MPLYTTRLNPLKGQKLPIINRITLNITFQTKLFTKLLLLKLFLFIMTFLLFYQLCIFNRAAEHVNNL